MKNTCFDLLKELEQRLKDVDNTNDSRFDKCSQKITICQQLTNQLRNRYFEANIQTADRQITFFKEIKPSFISELHFQKEVFQYYREQPKGSVKQKSAYITMCLEKADSYISKYCEFNMYIQLGLTHLDMAYFTLREYCPKIHGNLEYPMDPTFSSPGDPTLSCLLAANRFVQFMKNELFTLKNPSLDPSWEHMKTLEWHGSKTDLIELIYGLHSSGTLKCDLKDTILIMEKTFNIDLGYFYRLYTDIKLKKNPTSFIDSLKISLLAKMSAEN